MKATVTFYDGHNDVAQVQVGGHNIESSGQGSDGYCYAHQQWCVENGMLNAQELAAYLEVGGTQWEWPSAGESDLRVDRPGWS